MSAASWGLPPCRCGEGAMARMRRSGTVPAQRLWRQVRPQRADRAGHPPGLRELPARGSDIPGSIRGGPARPQAPAGGHPVPFQSVTSWPLPGRAEGGAERSGVQDVPGGLERRRGVPPPSGTLFGTRGSTWASGTHRVRLFHHARHPQDDARRSPHEAQFAGAARRAPGVWDGPPMRSYQSRPRIAGLLTSPGIDEAIREVARPDTRAFSYALGLPLRQQGDPHDLDLIARREAEARGCDSRGRLGASRIHRDVGGPIRFQFRCRLCVPGSRSIGRPGLEIAETLAVPAADPERPEAVEARGVLLMQRQRSRRGQKPGGDPRIGSFDGAQARVLLPVHSGPARPRFRDSRAEPLEVNPAVRKRPCRAT